MLNRATEVDIIQLLPAMRYELIDTNKETYRAFHHVQINREQILTKKLVALLYARFLRSFFKKPQAN